MLKSALRTVTKLSDKAEALEVERTALIKSPGEDEQNLSGARAMYDENMAAKTEKYAKVLHLLTPTIQRYARISPCCTDARRPE